MQRIPKTETLFVDKCVCVYIIDKRAPYKARDTGIPNKTEAFWKWMGRIGTHMHYIRIHEKQTQTQCLLPQSRVLAVTKTAMKNRRMNVNKKTNCRPPSLLPYSPTTVITTTTTTTDAVTFHL